MGGKEWGGSISGHDSSSKDAVKFLKACSEAEMVMRYAKCTDHFIRPPAQAGSTVLDYRCYNSTPGVLGVVVLV